MPIFQEKSWQGIQTKYNQYTEKKKKEKKTNPKQSIETVPEEA